MEVDFSPYLNALQNMITPAQILAILASVVGVGIAFVLMWFGVRFIVKSFSNAVTKGKLDLNPPSLSSSGDYYSRNYNAYASQRDSYWGDPSDFGDFDPTFDYTKKPWR